MHTGPRHHYFGPFALELPPDIYRHTCVLLLSEGAWQHLPFPTAGDRAATVHPADSQRLVTDVITTVAPRNQVPFSAAIRQGDQFRLELDPGPRVLPGTRLVLRDAEGRELNVTVHGLSTATHLGVLPEAGQPPGPAEFQLLQAYEQVVEGRAQSFVIREFTTPANAAYGEVWLSLDLEAALGARVYLDGQPLVEANLGAADTPHSSPQAMFFPLSRADRLEAGVLTAPLTGLWQPDGRAVDPLRVLDTHPRTAMLASFSGSDLEGMWTLFVADVSGGGEFRLDAWGLEVTFIPEPGRGVLLGLGLGGLAWLRARRRANAVPPET